MAVGGVTAEDSLGATRELVFLGLCTSRIFKKIIPAMSLIVLNDA